MTRYIVGIDLGTTNCAMAFIDLKDKKPAIQVHAIHQLIKPGEAGKLPLLPSFLYLPGDHELPAKSCSLPWDDARNHLCGEAARYQGAKVPGRLVSSAKSWLCHPQVDRKAPLLPWSGPPELQRISPVEASARYLRHLVESWAEDVRAGLLSEPLEKQTVIITVPASFDDLARSLTMEAARLAGLSNITLIEEPQAAFYRWMESFQKSSDSELEAGMQCLVLDIGGGTSDFTLIETQEEEGEISFNRIAVGDHLLLGGDNMDLALAKLAESKLPKGIKLDAAQFHQLIQACRNAKEQFLGESAPASIGITIMGRGSSVIGGMIKIEIPQADAMRILADGFFPMCEMEAKPSRPVGALGLHEMGLPYEPEPAISRHLAAFLSAHAQTGKPSSPDAILFNGGVFRSLQLQKRVLQLLADWSPNSKKPLVLQNPSVDLAVAQGAAWFGWLKHTGGAHIGGGSSKSYYLAIHDQNQEQSLLCVLPKNLEEGKSILLDQHPLELQIGQAVSFPLFTSTVRKKDKAGDLLKLGRKQLHPMPALQTILKGGKRSGVKTVPVVLSSQTTSLGTLELSLLARDNSNQWKLEFNLRDTVQANDEEPQAATASLETWPEESAQAACELLREVFSEEGSPLEPRELGKKLEETLDSPRDQWPVSLCRRFLDTLLNQAQNRFKSPAHASRWLNLAGYSMRPGYGAAGDKIRIDNIWRELIAPPRDAKNVAPKSSDSGADFWILWRRISGGLGSPQQQGIFDRLRNFLLPSNAKSIARPSPNELAEMWRCAASLERLDLRTKQSLGDTLVRQLKKAPAPSHLFWSLARLGARTLLHGPMNFVLHPEVVTPWIEKLLSFEPSHVSEEQMWAFALSQLGRVVNQRSLDVPDSIRGQIISKIHERQIPQSWLRSLREFVPLEREQQSSLLGDSLPAGLRLMS
jgi:molecular chaperone DnaK (HSP70)